MSINVMPLNVTQKQTEQHATGGKRETKDLGPFAMTQRGFVLNTAVNLTRLANNLPLLYVPQDKILRFLGWVPLLWTHQPWSMTLFHACLAVGNQCIT